jgi:hypothetical protein
VACANYSDEASWAARRTLVRVLAGLRVGLFAKRGLDEGSALPLVLGL